LPNFHELCGAGYVGLFLKEKAGRACASIDTDTEDTENALADLFGLASLG
jgi:hypothetical protein